MSPKGTNPSGTHNMGQGRTGGAGQAGTTGQPGGEAGTFQHVRDTVSDVAGQVREKVSDATSAVSDRLSDAWDSTKSGVREGYDKVADYAGTGWHELEGFIRRHPVTSCAIAFGLGMLACSLFSMRGTYDMPRRMERASD